MTDYVMVPKALLVDIGLKFESGNSVPVTRVTITEEEWSEVMRSAKPVRDEPVDWQFYCEESQKWRGFMNEEHKKNTIEAGYKVRALYDTPQPAQQKLPMCAESMQPGFVYLWYRQNRYVDAVWLSDCGEGLEMSYGDFWDFGVQLTGYMLPTGLQKPQPPEGE